MNKTVIIFTFCAVSTQSSYPMQLVTHIVRPRFQTHAPRFAALQKVHYCTMHNTAEVALDKKLQIKTNRLLLGNAAMCTANVVAACATSNPYFLLPLVPHAATIVGMSSINACMKDTSKEPALIRDLEFLSEKRTPTIEHLLYDIKLTDKQIQWLKNAIADEKILKAIGTKTELLEECIAVLDEKKAFKHGLEHKLIEYIAPIFNTHKDTNLNECLLYNEKKIATLNKAWLFKLPALPLALLPKFIRNTNKTFSSYSDAWQFLILFDATWMIVGTVFAASIFPIHVAASIANMEMAFQNQSFFEQKDIAHKKDCLKLITTLIKFQQEHAINKAETTTP